MTVECEQRSAVGADLYAALLAGVGGRTRKMKLHRIDGSLTVALHTAPPFELSVPGLSVARLSICLTASRVQGGLDDEPARDFQTQRFSIFLIPAQVPAFWRKHAPSRHLTLYFEPDALDGARSALSTPIVNGRLPSVQGLVEMLVDEIEREGDWAADAVDSLARLLLVRLVRHAARSEAATPTLTALQMCRLREHVQSHLDQRLLVAELASAVGLPPGRFARAFLVGTGQSPHQFVVEQRLRRAQELLRHSPLALADIALACGFASQQHLTRWMRRRLGITPAQWRAGDSPR